MNGCPIPGGRPAWPHTAVLALLLLAAALGAETPSAPADARDRIAALRAAIAHHDERYFRRAAPEITDAAYDALKRELATLERAAPAAAAALPPLPALADDHTDGFARARHIAPMRGLDKSYSEAELRAWYAGIAARAGGTDFPVVLEPKVDGVAFSALYEHGALVRVLTRGDGACGDDITSTARQITSLPARLAEHPADGPRNPIPERIELRGEVYVGCAEFARLNRERESAGEEPFAHPRNLAAGVLKQLAPEAAAVGALTVVFYNWGACEPATLAPGAQRSFHRQARRWGLPVLEPAATTASADALWRAVQTLDRERRRLPYPTDGAVAKVDSTGLRALLGDDTAAPRWALAHKFPAARASTRLRAITIQIGRSGRLTPVAELDPIRLAGATIARATLHNPAAIERLDLRIGDRVTLEKAGEIIPQIVANEPAPRAPTSTPYRFPANCPECGAPVAMNAERTEARCPNDNCAAQVRRRIEHFAAGVEIDGLGPATIETLVARGLVRDCADLYTLRHEQLVALPRLGAKTATALLAAIERSRRAEFHRLLGGLGIPRLGPVGSRAIATRYPDFGTLLPARETDLVALLGPAAGSELAAWLAQPHNRGLCARLAASRERPR